MSLISNIVKNVNYIVSQTGVGTPIGTGSTIGRGGAGTGVMPDTRAIATRIKAELNPTTVKDINGYGVGEGTEYKFFKSSLNLARGVDAPADFVNFIQSPVYRKLQFYAIINSKIKASVLQDFKDYYQFDWYSGKIPSEELDISTAIAKRLNDINLHLSGLQIALGNINVASVSAKVLETSEIITRVGISIASVIPQTRIVGVTAGTILQSQDLKDNLDLAVKANDINRDAKVLELEANALLNLYNSKAKKPTLTDSLLDNTDSQLRSTVLADNLIYILLALVVIIVIYLIFRNKNTQKRKK